MREITVERPARRRACGWRRGETIAADIVVSNADSAWTYRHLLPPERRRRWTDRRIERARYSMSLFVWYFGTRRRYPEVAHHTILLGPRYRELLHDIFERKVLADDFSLYLHRPTATDPSLAPAGLRRLLRALARAAPRQRHRLGGEAPSPTGAPSPRRLSRTLLPGLERERRHLAADDAAGFPGPAAVLSRAPPSAWSRVLTQSAWFRPHNRERGGASGLYLVGAGTHPGAGLPGVLSSARVLDRVVPHAAALV